MSLVRVVSGLPVRADAPATQSVIPAQTRRSTATLGGALFVGAQLVAVLAMVGALLALRQNAKTWIPEDARIDDYIGGTVALTTLLAAAASWWPATALRRDDRRYLGIGMAFTVLFGLAALNVLVWGIADLNVGAADGAYGSIVLGLLGTFAVVMAIGVAVGTVGLVRTVGGLTGARQGELAVAVAVQWTALAALALVVWYIVWIYV